MKVSGSDGVNIVQVKRRLGLSSGISLVVGTIIGSGIFISPKGVLQNAGSVGMCLVTWSVCGIISLLGALIYAELGTLIPRSGGEYAYLLVTYGSFPAFMCAWVMVVAVFPASNAIQGLTFAEYVIDAASDDCGPPWYTKRLLAAATILTITITNCISVRLVARVQIICTVVKVCGLLIIIIGGLIAIGKGETGSLSTGFDGTSENVGDFALAVYSGMFAFGGWQALNNVVEELQNPKRNLVLSLLSSIVIVTVVYLLVNVSYLAVMSKTEFLSSWAVGFTWGEKVLGPASIVITIAVAFSVYGAGNGGYFIIGRILFAAAREGHMPKVASYIHVNNQIPLIAVLTNTVLSFIMLIPDNVGTLLNFLSFLAWIFIGLCNLAVIILRYKLKDEPRVIKVPLIVPVFMTLLAVYLVVSPLIRNPRIEFLYALGYIVVGILLYMIFVFFGLSLPYMDTVTSYLQVFFQIEPTTGLTEEKDEKLPEKSEQLKENDEKMKEKKGKLDIRF